jgi:hypothetical protein
MMGPSRHCRLCRTTRFSGDVGHTHPKRTVERDQQLSRPFDAGVPAVGLISLPRMFPCPFARPSVSVHAHEKRTRTRTSQCSLRKSDCDSES